MGGVNSSAEPGNRSTDATPVAPGVRNTVPGAPFSDIARLDTDLFHVVFNQNEGAKRRHDAERVMCNNRRFVTLSAPIQSV